jgi:hypothetical protein
MEVGTVAGCHVRNSIVRNHRHTDELSYYARSMKLCKGWLDQRTSVSLDLSLPLPAPNASSHAALTSPPHISRNISRPRLLSCDFSARRDAEHRGINYHPRRHLLQDESTCPTTKHPMLCLLFTLDGGGVLTLLAASPHSFACKEGNVSANLHPNSRTLTVDPFDPIPISRSPETLPTNHSRHRHPPCIMLPLHLPSTTKLGQRSTRARKGLTLAL